jgi:hypothetical protein
MPERSGKRRLLGETTKQGTKQHRLKYDLNTLPSGRTIDAQRNRGVWVVIEVIIGVFIGFAFGYGVREIISQRRHVAARKHFFEQMAEHERPLSQQEHVDRLKAMATSTRLVTKSKR